MRVSRFVAAAALALGFVASGVSAAQAALLITVDKTAQRMTVEQDGLELFVWPVSTGARGYDTPSGNFKPFRMEKDHFSKEWDDAPMPNSIFFTMEGHAIHGTTHLKAIGTPASHGCVRLEPQNAETLWQLVKQEKMANTRVVLRGETPAPPPAPPSASAPAQKNPRTAAREPSPDDQDFTGALQDPRLEPRYDPRARPRMRVQGGELPYYDGRYYYDRAGRRYVVVGRDERGVRVAPEADARDVRPQQRYYRGGGWGGWD